MLKFTVNAIHDYQKTRVQILCGDFNLPWQKVKELETTLRLRTLNEEHVVTRSQLRKGKYFHSCLDYFLSDLPHSKIVVEESGIHSDHKLI